MVYGILTYICLVFMVNVDKFDLWIPRFSWYMFTTSSQAVGDLALFLEVLGPGVKMQAVFFQLTTFWLDLSLQLVGFLRGGVLKWRGVTGEP